MQNSQPKRLVQGEDFYIERGNYVFTEKFLRERGFCCKSGCRHCPYGFIKPDLQKEGTKDKVK